MKTVLIALSVVLAAACGGSSNGTTDRLANFTGSGGNASVTTTVSPTCPVLGGQSGTRTYSITFAPTTGADLQWTSAEGCVYKFNVSGNTASLSNAPVSCNFTLNGFAVSATWTSYTATTTDGRNLAIATAGTGSALLQTCPFTETGTATR